MQRQAGAWAVTVPTGYRVGAWEVTGGIATGSWGSVYAARRVVPPDGSTPAQEAPPQRAALKFLPTGTVTPRHVRHLAEMTSREVRFHEHLAHARLIRTFEVLTVDDPEQPQLDGAVVLVMEPALESLADVLRRRPGAPVPDAPRLLTEVCEGLAHMHAAGWVHGDLKPGNVLRMADGSVRLADFGLATELDGTHGYLPPAGSSDFLAPESRSEPLGERGRAVRTTADIWALGVTGYQLLTGHLPFPGSTARARAAAMAEYAAGRTELLRLDALPPQWRPVIADCLAVDHGRRAPHSAAVLVARMRAAAELPPTADRMGARRRGWAAAGGVGVLLAGAVTALVAVVDGDRRGRAAAELYPELLRTGVGIPAGYRADIVAAGRACPAPGLSPALVAAMLKVESDFNPRLRDPARDEYGIARWTPSVLAYHLPPEQQPAAGRLAFDPGVSIRMVGRYLCFLAPKVTSVQGDPALVLAATYRTSATKMRQAGRIPDQLRPHADRVGEYLRAYAPR